MSDKTEYPKNQGKGKILAGLILLTVGIVFLLQQLNFFFIPHFLFGWPMWLIVLGLFIGARHNFRNSSWLIMVAVGVVFLLDDALPGFNLRHVIWPVAIITLGIWLIVGRNYHWDQDKWDHKWEDKWSRKCEDKWRHKYRNGNSFEPVDYTMPEDAPKEPSGSTSIPPAGGSTTVSSDDDYLDTVAIFGGVNKIILSKNFKGGEIVNIFGGAELDFTQADINGRIVIDITQVFGGTKIIVPANWQVISDLAAVFAGIDDKRIKSAGPPDNNKILVLKGTSIFAGVDIRSY